MLGFQRLVSSEWIKLRKSSIWLLIFISPLLAAIMEVALIRSGETERKWVSIMSDMVLLHGFLFLPLLAGIFTAFICRYEHEHGGWKRLLALPVSRVSVYLAKFAMAAGLIAGTQLLFLVAIVIVGTVNGMPDIPWSTLLQSMCGGLVATLPLVALQLAVSVGWASFATPLAINVIATIPNILIVNSATYGPYYPWAQPLLAMMPVTHNNHGALNVSMETLLLVIVGGFAVFFLAGLTYFHRKEV
ncbi:ABC transporter permease [Gorillibacterium massiliense]|uniref:ABC transporter permease n=1 Tax=Gorillibacterium massiliense TaxID=1280390 RepID=UPI0004AFD09E|nr:ABC transporter permease [Gorillibacterium massiliense]